MNRLYNNRGYTLLFASLTAALVLGVAVFILSVSRRQFLLSANARNSMFAIYAADSGIECAVLRNSSIDDPSLTSVLEISSSTLRRSEFKMSCAGKVIVMKNVGTPLDNNGFFKNATPELSQSSGYLYTGAGTCAQLIITTGKYVLGDDALHAKTFESRGYNLCKPNLAGEWKPDSSSPSLVERALRLTYRGVW